MTMLNCVVLAWIFCKVMWRFGQIQTAAILSTTLWSQGIAWGCLQTYACTEALLLAPKPQQWSFEQMAAWSVTFATTEEAFQELAPLKHLVPATEGSDMGNHHMKPLFPLFVDLLQSLSKSRGWTLRVFFSGVNWHWWAWGQILTVWDSKSTGFPITGSLLVDYWSKTM